MLNASYTPPILKNKHAVLFRWKLISIKKLLIRHSLPGFPLYYSSDIIRDVFSLEIKKYKKTCLALLLYDSIISETKAACQENKTYPH